MKSESFEKTRGFKLSVRRVASLYELRLNLNNSNKYYIMVGRAHVVEWSGPIASFLVGSHTLAFAPL